MAQQSSLLSKKVESGTTFWNMTRRRYLMAWLFMLPALLILGVFTFYPLVYGVVLAFFQNNLVGTSKFIGFDNFGKAFNDSDFLLSLVHSALYLLIVPCIQIASLAVAMLLNNQLRGVTVFRALFYLPVITSLVVAGVVWKEIYAQDDGLINGTFHWFNEVLTGTKILRFHGPNWLGDTALALGSIAFVTFWKGLGYYMVIYLAGLQSVPKELEEAGRLDGAKGLTLVRHVIIPLMMPTIALCTILSTIAALRVFDEVYVIGGGIHGDPNKSTLVASTYIYGQAFHDFNFGYAAALSLILAAFIWLITLVNLKFFSKGGLEYYS